MDSQTSSWLAQLLGFSSTYAFLQSSGLLSDGAKLLLLGFIAEIGRRIMRWFIDRFRFPITTRAKFSSRDPAYQWLVSFLTDENVWLKSRNFQVEAKSSQRRWKVKPPNGENKHVDYVPAYNSLHFFRWNGYFLEVKLSSNEATFVEEADGDTGAYKNVSFLTVILYTLDISVLSAFVDECRLRYVDHSKPSVTVHSTDSSSNYERNHWNNVKVKPRRPLESLILDKGMMEDLMVDAREFLSLEDWYVNAGIPHRRGYLLYGPPGTGKTSTVYAVAGELRLEIFSLSLASSHVDDSSLSRAVSKLPRQAILLIEDIDCAFPTREDDDEELYMSGSKRRNDSSGDEQARSKSQVTLSGLLNVLDGVGSEDGKIFFATTNYIDRLDPALLRPGRIDRKFEYKPASREQARAMFNRFFPESKYSDVSKVEDGPIYSDDKSVPDIHELADEFSREVPEHEFSTAELQGYFLNWKTSPRGAAHGIKDWVEQEREIKRAREARAKLRRDKAEALRKKDQLEANEAMIAGIGAAISHVQGTNRDNVPAASSSSPKIDTLDGLPPTDLGAVLQNTGSGEMTRDPPPKEIVNGTNHLPRDSSPSVDSIDNNG